jgi:hypothetical protein
MSSAVSSSPAAFSTPARSIKSLAPNPAAVSAPGKCCKGGDMQHRDSEGVYNGVHQKRGTGYKLLVGLVVFLAVLAVSAILLYLGRPPLVLEEVAGHPHLWSISQTKLWGWSALFAFLIALLAMVVS